MNKTIVIYGSTTGSCEEYAGRIAERLGVEAINITDVDTAKLNEYDNLILGTSTWGDGELQDDWFDGIDTVKSADLKGKTVAIFGCGDAEGYSDTFCGALIEIYNAVKHAGGTVVGEVDASTYGHSDSASVVDGKFVGLALDINESENQINERIGSWVEQILPTLG